MEHLSFDVDECQNSPLGNNATCNNTEGSFTCSCDVGYEGDGFQCTSNARVTGILTVSFITAACIAL